MSAGRSNGSQKPQNEKEKGAVATESERFREWIEKPQNPPPELKSKLWELYDGAELGLKETLKRMDELVGHALDDDIYAIVAEIGMAAAEATLPFAHRFSREDGSVEMSRFLEKVADMFSSWAFEALAIRLKLWALMQLAERLGVVGP